jgi:hypothetical protein
MISHLPLSSFPSRLSRVSLLVRVCCSFCHAQPEARFPAHASLFAIYFHSGCRILPILKRTTTHASSSPRASATERCREIQARGLPPRASGRRVRWRALQSGAQARRRRVLDRLAGARRDREDMGGSEDGRRLGRADEPTSRVVQTDVPRSEERFEPDSEHQPFPPCFSDMVWNP